MNWPSSVVSMAPAMPITAEPSTNTCRWRAVTSLPIAPAAVSLSRMARIMRPQGERKAVSDSKVRTASTSRNRPA